MPNHRSRKSKQKNVENRKPKIVISIHPCHGAFSCFAGALFVFLHPCTPLVRMTAFMPAHSVPCEFPPSAILSMRYRLVRTRLPKCTLLRVVPHNTKYCTIHASSYGSAACYLCRNARSATICRCRPKWHKTRRMFRQAFYEFYSGSCMRKTTRFQERRPQRSRTSRTR